MNLTSKVFNKRIPVLLVFLLGFNAAFAQISYTDSLRNSAVRPLKNDKVFVTYFNRFILLVKNNDKRGLARFLDNSYKKNLRISLDKPKGKLYETVSFPIKNRKDFLRYYSKVFDKRMRVTISTKQITGNDFIINYNGFGLHRGQVWFQYSEKNKNYYISSINNNNYIFP